MPTVAPSSRVKLSNLVLVFLLASVFLPTPHFWPLSRLGVAQASAVEPVVRISQVYGGGGNSSSTYGCDFVELFNSSGEAVELRGWSAQFPVSGGWRVIEFGTITISPNSYYLIASDPCEGSNRPPVPPPDFVTGSLGLATTKNSVALVSNEVEITGASDPDVIDLVGYGSGSPAEGAPTAALSSTTAAHRKDGGCRDTNKNSEDFDVLTPLARNSASPRHACAADAAPAVVTAVPADGAADVALDSNFSVTFSEPVNLSGDWFRIECDLRGTVTPATAAVSGGPVSFAIDPTEDLFGDDACVFTVFAAGVRDQDAADPPDAMTGDYQIRFTTETGACGDPAYPIHALQGDGTASPLSGKVRTVEAVVVGDFQGADRLEGCFVEEEAADQDDDAGTSEGLFVSDGSAPLFDAVVGQRVRLTGRVAELDGMTALVELTRALDCGPSATPPPFPMDLPVASTESWEQVEGMRVAFDEALTVAGSDELASAGRLSLAAGERPLVYTQQHAPDAAGYAAFQDDLRRRSFIVDDGSDSEFPDPIVYPAPGLSASNTVRAGDHVAAGLEGVVDGAGSSYRLHPLTPPVFVRDNPRPASPASEGGNLRVIFLGLDDYFTPDGGVYGPRGASNANELQRQRDKLIAALTGADGAILAVSQRENDGTGPDSALADLVAGLNEATGAGAYAAIGPDTAWGSGETTVGLIYRTDRVVPVGTPAMLDSGVFSQGASAPTHAAPLAQTFEEATWGERLTVVVNQWRGRDDCPPDGADADQGDGQGCWNAARVAAANELAAWLSADPTGANDPDVLVLGELNAFRLEEPVQNLRASGFADLVERFAGERATTQIWAGGGGYADHALSSASLAEQVVGAAVWSINADEPSALDYQTENKSAGQIESLYAPDPHRSADRDPVVVDLSLLPDQSEFTGDYGLAWHTGQGEWRLGAGWGGADDGVARGAGSWNDGRGEVTVTVNGPANRYACLYAWLDYSDGSAQAGAPAGAPDSPNGRWDDNEKVIDALALASGADQPVTFPLPVGVIDGSKTYNMRFRLVPAQDSANPTCDVGEMATGLAPTGRADGGEVEDWAFAAGPLAVRIAAFAAHAFGETTYVTWQTVDEIDVVGFDVFEAAMQDGPWQRLNDRLIPAKSPGATEGAVYTYAYRSGEQPRWHRLEALEASGARYSFGPVLAEESNPTAVTVRNGVAERVSSGWATAAQLGCMAAAIILWVSLRRRTR